MSDKQASLTDPADLENFPGKKAEVSRSSPSLLPQITHHSCVAAYKEYEILPLMVGLLDNIIGMFIITLTTRQQTLPMHPLVLW